jgi:membrane protein DedA with SNARE-associated domain
MLDRFLDWMVGLPPLATYPILMVLSALENIFPPVPADVAVVLGAFISQRGRTSPVWVGVLCWLANTASSAGMYFLARARGRSFFTRGWASKLMPPEDIDALERAYRRHGVLGIFVSRFLPGVRAAVTPFAGVVGMRPLRARVPAATASAIWYTALVIVGSALGLNWDTARELVDKANRWLALLSVLVTAAVVFWLWRRRRAHRAR